MDARGLSALLSVSYVGSVYLFPGARESFRNDAGVLGRRLVGVVLFTIVVMFRYGDGMQQWAGFHGEPTVRAILRSIMLIHVLYIAPLLAFGYPKRRLPSQLEGRLQWFRDYLIGPASEEFIYRGVIVSIYRNGGLSMQSALTENFLYFGFAHVHHAVMQWLGGESTFREAAMASLIHFVITSLFGTYACYLFIHTGSIWPSIVSHIFCNLFGPPQLSGGPVWYVPTLFVGLGMWLYMLKFL